jgi:hypothetical protein
MYLGDMECCAMKEIAELKEHTGQSSEQVLLEFLKKFDYDVWSPLEDGKGHYGYVDKFNVSHIPAFIVFSEIVETYYEDDDAYIPDDDDDYYDDDNPRNSDFPKGYGKPLAELIQSEGLGEIVKPEPARNRVNHPLHLVQPYLWRTDAEAMERWYLKHKEPAQ